MGQVCEGTYLAEDLANFGTCDEVALITQDRIRRVHVVSMRWMREAQLHVRCDRDWAC